MTPVEAAAAYLAAGWAVVPVEPESKSPKIHDWPMLAAERAFAAEDFDGYNVGVVLGSVSGDLVDIDLDSAAAVALAPAFLPATLTFGRASKRASHWLYKSSGVRSAMHFFWVPAASEGRPTRELVEIRSTNASSDVCGHQSVFPGSMHESGEAVEWDAASGDAPDMPAEIDGADLCWRVARLTVASAILNTYGEGQGRNAQTLGYCGGLLKSGWTADEVRELFDAVRAASGEDRAKDKDAVERVIAAFENGTDVQGFGSLINDGAVPEAIVKSVERHAMTPEARLRAVKLASTGAGAGARARMLAEARAVDGIAGAADLVAQWGGAHHGQHTQSGQLEPAGATDEPAGWGDIGFTPFAASAEPAPLEYVWGPFAAGKVSAIIGYAYCAKTPTALLLGVSIATGRPCFGLTTKKRRVMYAAFEGARNARRKAQRICRALGTTLATIEEHFVIGAVPTGALDPEYVARLEAAAVAQGVGVVMIDTYGSALNAGIERNTAAFSECLKLLGDMSDRTDILVIVLLHERKTDAGKRRGSGLEMIDGHNSAAGALQGAITLTRPKAEDKTLIRIECARTPDDAFADVDVRWEDVTDPSPAKTSGQKMAAAAAGDHAALRPDQWGLRAAVVEASQADETRAQIQLAVLEHLQTYRPEGDPIGKTELVAALRRNQTAVSDAIDAMVSAGVLVGNYDPKSLGRGKSKLVWLPGKKNSAIG